MFPSTLPSAFEMLKYRLRCFFQISLLNIDIFGANDTVGKQWLWYITFICSVLSPYKSIFTDVPRTEERQSSVSQEDLERRQVWIHVACQILSTVELNSLSMLDLTSVSRVCSQHKSHGGKMEHYIPSRRENILYGSEIQSHCQSICRAQISDWVQYNDKSTVCGFQISWC